MKTEKNTCLWPGTDEKMHRYHDEEWGVPVHDDQKHFEFIVLDTFQAGLSWKTILHKRENFRKAFDQFNVHKIARYNERSIQRLMNDAGIIRNQLKIRATVSNAQSFIGIQKEHGSFDSFIWQFTRHQTIKNKLHPRHALPATSPESDAMSKALYAKGFKFVGSTICYAYMQAAGMVNDHLVTCFRYHEL
ncbi:MAG TPA: DNA-3-methyladenine glycosylase I [Chitinophagaceae bacterium]|nr:DNA-3-methyladenine glycosylase I [Chitinophagaceae bacterium]HNF72255.1 DNA-3-methyladenine glycosylase I [Chitinophagaceae bacterium]